MGYNAGADGKSPQFDFMGSGGGGDGQAPAAGGTNFASLFSALQKKRQDEQGAQQGFADTGGFGSVQGNPQALPQGQNMSTTGGGDPRRGGGDQSQLLAALRAHRAQGTQQQRQVPPGMIRGGGYGGQQQGGWRGGYGNQQGGGQQQFYAPGQPNPNQIRRG